jgi:hypothetical protein
LLSRKNEADTIWFSRRLAAAHIKGAILGGQALQRHGAYAKARACLFMGLFFYSGFVCFFLRRCTILFRLVAPSDFFLSRGSWCREEATN